MTNGRCGSTSLLARPSSADDCASRERCSAGDEKRRLRRAAKNRRAALMPEQRYDAALRIAERAFPVVEAAVLGRDKGSRNFDAQIPGGDRVAGYAAIGTEVDVTPLLNRLAAVDWGLALPVVVGRDRPLLFRDWMPGQPLMPDRYGVPCPAGDARPCRPAVLLVPLLAFDRRGYRLGYGGGFYDRTLATYRRQGAVSAIGIAFADQEVSAVPANDHDQRLDWIITDRDAISVSREFVLAINPQ